MRPVTITSIALTMSRLVAGLALPTMEPPVSRQVCLRLFTIYKQKPVGTKFVQMVSKNSQMGNSVGIGAYHLQNSFKFTEGVWRKAKSWGNANGKHVFKIVSGNFALLF